MECHESDQNNIEKSRVSVSSHGCLCTFNKKDVGFYIYTTLKMQYNHANRFLHTALKMYN